MTEEIKVDLELDLKGLVCPLPMIKVSQNIDNVPIGGVVKAVTTDAAAIADISSWARSTGNQIVKYERSGEETTFYIRRLMTSTAED